VIVMSDGVSLKSILPRSLFARSLLILTLPIILTLLISIYIFFDGHWRKTASKMVVGVASEVSYLVGQVSLESGAEFVQKLSDESIEHFQLSLKYVADGKINLEENKYTGRGQVIQKTLSQELNKRIKEPYVVVVDTQEKWTQVHVQLGRGALIVTAPQRRLFSSSGYAFLLWMVSVSAVLLIVAVLFMRNQIRPIKRLAVAAERFGKGRDVPFFKPEGAREVRAAARSFIGMRNRINKQIQTRTAMLAGVSHDLRTPLTRMKLQVEMMPEGNDRESLKTDVQDMERMINAYLEFAKGDGNEPMQRINVLEVLKRQEELFKRDGFEVVVTSQTEKNFETVAMPVAFERCVSNLLSNAQKYAKATWVSLSRNDEYVTVIIDDDGVGIPKEKYEDVFRPFYREEKSRNSKTGGVGLGLPIAQDIILAHGGDIFLDESSKGGLRVVVKLPV